jgi:coenzyme F420-dependent glucose-6-phosphate dehydrogenase
LIEAVQIIDRVWYPERPNDHTSIKNEGFVHFRGEYFLIRNAKLYSKPASHIPIFIAASEKSIKDNPETKNMNSKEKIVEYKVSYSDDYEKALDFSKFWSATLLNNAFNTNISDPRQLEYQAKAQVSNEMLKESIEVITSIEDYFKSIEEYFTVGFTRVYVHSTQSR